MFSSGVQQQLCKRELNGLEKRKEIDAQWGREGEGERGGEGGSRDG